MRRIGWTKKGAEPGGFELAGRKAWSLRKAANDGSIPRSRGWLWGTACLIAGTVLLTAVDRGQQGPAVQQAPAAGAEKAIAAPEVIKSSNAPQPAQAQEQASKAANLDAANSERKNQFTDDSARLLKLANELKTEVDKTDKDTLSIGVIRKADEIEKLAHRVREKMKQTVAAD